MNEDAGFLDASDTPLRLQARGSDDLQVISALVQDAVFPASEMAWRSNERRFAVLLNRFRWEDSDRHEPERVRSLLVINEVMGLSSRGMEPGDDSLILSLLSIGFSAGPEGSGKLLLTLAGDGEIAVDIEVLDVTLKDVTKPYTAPSRSVPHHPEQ